MKNIFLLTIIGICFFSIFIAYRLFFPLNYGKEGELLLVDVPSGKTFYQLAEELEEKKLIRSHWDMKLLVKLFDLPSLPKGQYKLSNSQSVWTIFQTLRQGKDQGFLVSFPEGLNHYEMVEILRSHNWPAAEDFLKSVWDKKLVKKILKKDIDSFEGYLFPDSYRLKKYMDAQTLIELMTHRFLKVYENLASLPLERDLNQHQVVTFASLIEKETGVPEERSLIAGVFFNRLKLNMKLQTDPTILYALYLEEGFNRERNIRKKDILFSSPYNTYVVYGFPPGPIANPGEKSLEAVFLPKKSDFLYFVSRNDGSHKFSKTYKEHEKAVYRYQIKPFKR